MKGAIRLFFFSLVSIGGGLGAAWYGRKTLDARYNFPKLWAFQEKGHLQHVGMLLLTIGGLCVAIAGVWLLLSKFKEVMQEKSGKRKTGTPGLFSNLNRWTMGEAFKFYWTTTIARAFLVLIGVVIWITIRVFAFGIPLADM